MIRLSKGSIIALLANYPLVGETSSGLSSTTSDSGTKYVAYMLYQTDERKLMVIE